MIDYEKLLDALKTIQDECAKYKFCTDCPFFVHSDDNNCGILSRNPVNEDYQNTADSKGIYSFKKTWSVNGR